MRITLGVLISFISAGVAYGVDPYIAIGAEIGNFETQPSSTTQLSTGSFTGTALNGRVGIDLFKHFGVEVEGAVRLSGTSTAENLSTGFNGAFRDDAEVQSRVGFFLRGRAPVSERVEIFARAGVGGRKETSDIRETGFSGVDGTFFDRRRERSEGNGFVALGLGVEYQVSDDGKNAVRADFTGYSAYIGGEDRDKSYANDSVFSAAYVRRF